MISFDFTIKPRDFSNGLAYTEPISKKDFNFCFINKKGEVVLKEKEGLPLDVEGERVFRDGYFH